MGVVYYATHIETASPAAVKTIRPDYASSDSMWRFARESALIGELDHPHIVGFKESGAADGYAWFAMEFVSGHDLRTLTLSVPVLPSSVAVNWGLQILSALSYAHGRGIIHRDVKPTNAMLTTVGGREVVKVMDFGLAKEFAAIEGASRGRSTPRGYIGGTPAYMPLEQYHDFRSTTPLADQYSAAASIYWLLTKNHPRPIAAVLTRGTPILIGDLSRPEPVALTDHRDDLPEGLVRAVHKALSLEPSDRFPDVDAFADALRPFADE